MRARMAAATPDETAKLDFCQKRVSAVAGVHADRVGMYPRLMMS